MELPDNFCWTKMQAEVCQEGWSVNDWKALARELRS